MISVSCRLHRLREVETQLTMAKTVTSICLGWLIPFLATNVVDCMFAGTGIEAVTLPDSLTEMDLTFLSPFNPDVKLGPPTHPLLAQNSEGSLDSYGIGDDSRSFNNEH